MPFKTPLEVISTLVNARNRGDIETAASCYEPNATIMVQPGVTEVGMPAIKKALNTFKSLKPSFEVKSREIVEGEGIALHYCWWFLSGSHFLAGEVNLSGQSTDVLRQQPDGGWLLSIDNPWGSTVLDID